MILKKKRLKVDFSKQPDDETTYIHQLYVERWNEVESCKAKVDIES